ETNEEKATTSSMLGTTSAVKTCPDKEFEESSVEPPSVKPPSVKRPWLSHAKSPEYTIYQDTDVDFAAKSGTIPVELRHRIIRGTINNMVSVAYSPPWNRQPTNNEILEMAKSIIITYPPLKDPETKHGVIFKQLKKRLYNVKPATKESKKGKQGKKKVLKQSKITTDDDDISVQSDCSSKQKSQSPCPKNIVLEDSDDTYIYDDESDVDDSTDSPNIMLRHYNALIK
ncbi:uncharacterized protein LOC117120386, partial [Anneissia japonica]|uniref:uncharacterized protein LOC117120386 n=1 Tax=Anneissia japonica TaxID=1529436 RepID=UPI001425A467